MLAISINGQLFAQNSTATTSSIFDQPQYPKLRYTIALDKGNKLNLVLEERADLSYIKNINNLFTTLLNDLEPFKDSLADKLITKRIDYLVDTNGLKKIRTKQIQPNGASYLVLNGDIASLKIEQDTINYIGMIAAFTNRKTNGPAPVRYYRLQFLLNDVRDLPIYLDGRLNEKLATITKNTGGWESQSDGEMHLMNDQSISSKVPKGYVSGGDFLELNVAANLENYKNYFVPSFSVGAAVTFSNSFSKKQAGLFWEPHFIFAQNNFGKLQTYRNDFLTVTLGRRSIKNNDPYKAPPFLGVLSLGYLIKREGNYFNKNTFRLAGGRLSLSGGKVKLEPAIYFNNFFKGVTPSLRLGVYF